MKRVIVLPEELQTILQEIKDLKELVIQNSVSDPIFSTESVMKLMGVSRRTLQTWRDDGIIKFSSIKGKFYYRLSDIKTLLDNNLIN